MGALTSNICCLHAAPDRVRPANKDRKWKIECSRFYHWIGRSKSGLWGLIVPCREKIQIFPYSSLDDRPGNSQHYAELGEYGSDTNAGKHTEIDFRRFSIGSRPLTFSRSLFLSPVWNISNSIVGNYSSLLSENMCVYGKSCDLRNWQAMINGRIVQIYTILHRLQNVQTHNSPCTELVPESLNCRLVLMVCCPKTEAIVPSM